MNVAPPRARRKGSFDRVYAMRLDAAAEICMRLSRVETESVDGSIN